MNRRELLRAIAGAGALAAVSACTSTERTLDPGPTVPDRPPTSTSPPDVVPSAPSTATNATELATTTVVPEPTPPQPDPIAPPESAWLPGTPATFLQHGRGDSDLVALTFHFAGAPALATRLLDLLKANEVTSTLFAIGDWLTVHPTLARRALDDGHELGNHTKSHQPMMQLDRAAVHAEIAGGAAALVPFIGSIGRWFRPSGTDVPSQMILEEAGKVGYPVSVGYDIDSRDFTEPGARAVIDNVVPNLRAGAIVSLHFGHSDTIAALPSILDGLAQRGLVPATISQLVAG